MSIWGWGRRNPNAEFMAKSLVLATESGIPSACPNLPCLFLYLQGAELQWKPSAVLWGSSQKIQGAAMVRRAGVWGRAESNSRRSGKLIGRGTVPPALTISLH